MHGTRYKNAVSGRYYRYEMTDADHRDLIKTLLEAKGMVALSGYDSEIYRELLSDWSMNSTSARISAGRGTSSRQECLWLNPACMNALHRSGLQLGATA